MKKITKGQSRLFNTVRQLLYFRWNLIKYLDAKIVGPFSIQC